MTWDPIEGAGETAGAWIDELIDDLADVLDEVVNGKVPARLGPKLREILRTLDALQPEIGDQRALTAAQRAYDRVIVEDLIRSLQQRKP
jgi:hypothetical protein